MMMFILAERERVTGHFNYTGYDLYCLRSMERLPIRTERQIYGMVFGRIYPLKLKEHLCFTVIA